MYRLVITRKALKGITQISQYISRFFGKDTAVQKVQELRQRIDELGENPYEGHEPSDDELRRNGFLKLTTDKDVVLYKVNEEAKTVTIYLIADQRQDYISLL